MSTQRKLIIGWFSFTCSEDSTILLTELLNTHLAEWKEALDFRYFKALKSNNSKENLDVAFIEGAISSQSQAEELKYIRANAKYLIAIGACACTGQPSATRNAIDPTDVNFKTAWYLKHFDYDTVKKVADYVTVDDQVNGCPMDPTAFLQIMDKYIKLINST